MLAFYLQGQSTLPAWDLHVHICSIHRARKQVPENVLASFLIVVTLAKGHTINDAVIVSCVPRGAPHSWLWEHVGFKVSYSASQICFSLFWKEKNKLSLLWQIPQPPFCTMGIGLRCYLGVSHKRYYHYLYLLMCEWLILTLSASRDSRKQTNKKPLQGPSVCRQWANVLPG